MILTRSLNSPGQNVSYHHGPHPQQTHCHGNKVDGPVSRLQEEPGEQHQHWDYKAVQQLEHTKLQTYRCIKARRDISFHKTSQDDEILLAASCFDRAFMLQMGAGAVIGKDSLLSISSQVLEKACIYMSFTSDSNFLGGYFIFL